MGQQPMRGQFPGHVINHELMSGQPGLLIGDPDTGVLLVMSGQRGFEN